MSRHRHALVIGKFYPPHLGHHALIRHAATVADRVTVVVMASMVETIDLADRVAWLTDSHQDDPRIVITGIICDAPIDLGSEAVWAAQVACMRAAVAQVTGEPVDVVVSSEPYGAELARRFNADHHTFDIQRERFSVSGTAVRSNLAEHWGFLDAPTRAGLTTRIVVVGSESTGTTTLSRALAQHYRDRGEVWADTRWVPEYGRQATLDKLDRLRETTPTADMNDVTWDGDDFATIARTQQTMEDDAARSGSPLLVCDTDAFATSVWERRYLGPDSARAVTHVGGTATIYLLTDHHGVNFVQDGIRDGEHIRAEMTDWFISALTATRRSWVLMTGSPEQRLALAIRVADLAINHRSRFADPIEML